MNSRFGNLYLIPTLLGATTAEQVIPQGTLEIVRKIRFFVVENIRTARRFLKQVDKSINIDELLVSQPDYGEQALEITKKTVSGIACDNGAGFCINDGVYYTVAGNEDGDCYFYDANDNFRKTNINQNPDILKTL